MFIKSTPQHALREHPATARSRARASLSVREYHGLASREEIARFPARLLVAQNIVGSFCSVEIAMVWCMWVPSFLLYFNVYDRVQREITKLFLCVVNYLDFSVYINTKTSTRINYLLSLLEGEPGLALARTRPPPTRCEYAAANLAEVARGTKQYLKNVGCYDAPVHVKTKIKAL